MGIRLAAPLAAALGLAAGCLWENPGFDAHDGATTTSGSTGPALTTAGPTAGTTSTGSGSDSLGGTTTGTTTGASTDGTAGAHDPVALDATVGTCIMLPLNEHPYVGPDACEGIASLFNDTAQTGLTLVDTDLNSAGGNDRAGLAFFRFDLSPDLVGLPIQSLTLELQVGDGMSANGDGGHLHSTIPFDLDTLQVAAPDKIAELAAPKGAVGVGELVTWDIDPSALTGETLFLGLWPSSSTTVIYHGHRSSITKPRLRIVFQ